MPESTALQLTHEQQDRMSSGVSIELRIGQLFLCAFMALALNVSNLFLVRNTYLSHTLSEPLQVAIPVLALLSFTLWSYARDRSLKRLVAFTLISMLLARMVYGNAPFVVFMLRGGGVFV